MARMGLTGQIDSQPATPNTKFRLYYRDRKSTFIRTICTACVGQCSEQAPQSVFSVLTIQRSYRKLLYQSGSLTFPRL